MNTCTCAPELKEKEKHFQRRRSICFESLKEEEKIMGRMDYLAMKTDDVDTVALVNSDMEELKVAAKKLFSDVSKLGGLGFGVSFLKFLASFAAIYLLILDRTNWKTKMLTSLLIPYIFLSLPSVIFNFLSGDVGKWIAFVAVVLRLFFPKHFPDWLEMPGSLILLLVVSPHFLAHHIRGTWIGTVISLFIGCYLLQEHIRASGGFRNSFTQPRGVSNTLGIILLLVYPVWALIVRVM